MASCKNCNKNVGCSCNLINSLCFSCHTKEKNSNLTPAELKEKKVVNLDLTTKVMLSRREKQQRIQNIINKNDN